MSPEEIDKQIEDWHFNGAGEGQDLHEYLGWTWEQYAHWAVTGVIPNQWNL